MVKLLGTGSTPTRNPFDAARLGQDLAKIQATSNARALAERKFLAAQANIDQKRIDAQVKAANEELEAGGQGAALKGLLPERRPDPTGATAASPLTPVEEEAAGFFGDVQKKTTPDTPLQKLTRGLPDASVRRFAKDFGLKDFLLQIAPSALQKRERGAKLSETESKAITAASTARKTLREEQDRNQLRDVTASNAEQQAQFIKAGDDAELARVKSTLSILSTRLDLAPTNRAHFRDIANETTKIVRERGPKFFGVQLLPDGSPRDAKLVKFLVRQPFDGHKVGSTQAMLIDSKADVAKLTRLIDSGAVYPADKVQTAADAAVFQRSLQRTLGRSAGDARAAISNNTVLLTSNRQFIELARNAPNGAFNLWGDFAEVGTGIGALFGVGPETRDRFSRFVTGGFGEQALEQIRGYAKLDKTKLQLALTGETDNKRISLVEQRNVDNFGRFTGTLRTGVQVRALAQMIGRTRIGAVARLQMDGRLPETWDTSTAESQTTLRNTFMELWGLNKTVATQTVEDVILIQLEWTKTRGGQ